jgi:hypothetical protein
MGSFVKFLSETYGRETIKLIWTKGSKEIERSIGKNLSGLEQEWLLMLKSITYKDVKYPL